MRGDIAASHNAADYERVAVVNTSDGSRRAGYRIHCSTCGETDEFTLAAGATVCDQTFADRRFRGRGWDLGRTRKGDTCPACVQARQEERRQRRHHNVVPLQAPTPQEETPTMDKNPPDASSGKRKNTLPFAERLRVYKFLETVIASEETDGERTAVYIDDWSDERAAQHLGVTVPNVYSLRQEMFGTLRPKAQEKLSTKERVTRIEQRLEKLERVARAAGWDIQ